jgi:serine/threonine protein kinase
MQETVSLKQIQMTWESLTGKEDFRKTIKETAKKVSTPSQLHIKQHEIADQPEPDADPPPDFELTGTIGEGGMGIVYTARQRSMDRIVALKMLKGEQDQKTKDILISEAVALGDLAHPNIVPIHDLGSNSQGQMFYSMKNVKGTPWNQIISERTEQQNIETLLRVCDAVAFAHCKGVVPTDLKPENVMLGE